MKLIKLSKSHKYRKFVNKKNQTLEALLVKQRAKCGDILRQFGAMVQVEINRSYPSLNKEYIDPATKSGMDALLRSIDRHAHFAAIEAATIWQVLRYYSHLLSQAAEQQALINALGGKPKLILKDAAISAALATTHSGPVFDRCYLSFTRLRNKIMDAVEVSRMLGNSLDECMARVIAAFPATKEQGTARAIPRIKEAARSKEDTFQFSDFISEDDWADFIAEYKSEFVPRWRDLKTGKLDSPVSIGDEDGFVTHSWELEQNMTNDFVTSVRNGEHEGAKAQGIADFVWIDLEGPHGKSHEGPCEYCSKRDGLTTSEIEAKLKDEWASDPDWSKSAVVPLHPFCYCVLQPATEDLPDVPDSNAAEFEDWLNA